jgi:hypothetical protein
MKSGKSALFLLCAVLAGCASNAENITANYVSPNNYSKWSCRELEDEAQRVSAAAASAAGVQNSKATNDAVATGVAIVVFWPAAFLIKGDGASAANLANLKGEMQAIQTASTQKKCNIRFQTSAS